MCVYTCTNTKDMNTGFLSSYSLNRLIYSNLVHKEEKQTIAGLKLRRTSD